MGGIFFGRVLCHVDPMHCRGHIWPFATCDPPPDDPAPPVRFQLSRPLRWRVSREQVEYWMAQRAALLKEFAHVHHVR